MNNTIVEAPIAEKIPTEMTMHGDSRVDNYFWMRLSDEQKEAKNKDDQTKKVEDYLHAENAYYDEITAHTNDFQTSLFEEMKGRIKEDDSSVPYKRMDISILQNIKKENNTLFLLGKKNL